MTANDHAWAIYRAARAHGRNTCGALDEADAKVCRKPARLIGTRAAVRAVDAIPLPEFVRGASGAES